jgi:hypothetical protein
MNSVTSSPLKADALGGSLSYFYLLKYGEEHMRSSPIRLFSTTQICRRQIVSHWTRLPPRCFQMRASINAQQRLESQPNLYR